MSEETSAKTWREQRNHFGWALLVALALEIVMGAVFVDVIDGPGPPQIHGPMIMKVRIVVPANPKPQPLSPIRHAPLPIPPPPVPALQTNPQPLSPVRHAVIPMPPPPMPMATEKPLPPIPVVRQNSRQILHLRAREYHHRHPHPNPSRMTRIIQTQTDTKVRSPPQPLRPPVATAGIERATDRYAALVNREVQADLRVPPMVKMMHLSGVAMVAIRIAPDGALLRVAMIRSSGAPSIDRAALAAVRATRFPHFSEAMSNQPIVFNLQVKLG